jgi:hypothetical protein
VGVVWEVGGANLISDDRADDLTDLGAGPRSIGGDEVTGILCHQTVGHVAEAAWAGGQAEKGEFGPFSETLVLTDRGPAFTPFMTGEERAEMSVGTNGVARNVGGGEDGLAELVEGAGTEAGAGGGVADIQFLADEIDDVASGAELFGFLVLDFDVEGLFEVDDDFHGIEAHKILNFSFSATEWKVAWPGKFVEGKKRVIRIRLGGLLLSWHSGYNRISALRSTA